MIYLIWPLFLNSKFLEIEIEFLGQNFMINQLPKLSLKSGQIRLNEQI
jgi:hypothetical protein